MYVHVQTGTIEQNDLWPLDTWIGRSPYIVQVMFKGHMLKLVVTRGKHFYLGRKVFFMPQPIL